MATMPLRVLVVEDSADDAELMLRELRRGGYQPQSERVESAEQMRASLARCRWDIVIADHSMPRFDALGALAVLQESGLDLPFLIVSGSIGEDVAVAAMKAGAHDYMIKGALARLVPAVRRELQEAQIREARRRADEALRRANEELEAKVAQRTAELSAANERLVASALDAQLAAERERDLGRELAQANDRLRAVLDGILDEVWYCDAQGQISPANHAAVNRLADVTSTIGLPTITTLSGDMYASDGRPLKSEDAPLFRALGGETVSDFEIVVRRESVGELQHCQVTAVPIRDHEDSIAGAVAVVRDISEQKRVERFRQEYVSLISHDLRNPLTSIVGWTDWLRQRLNARDLGREKQAVESMLANAHRMNDIIQDLLETSKLESGQIDLDVGIVDLKALLSEVLGRFGTAQEQSRVQLLLPAEVPPVRADAGRLERVVVNLLSNGLKYSPDDSVVTLGVSVQPSEALVQVIDHGAGIPAQELLYLFERFYRATASNGTEGLGLGLYIARLIVEAHKGRIWVESVPGAGSTFSFTLPLA